MFSNNFNCTKVWRVASRGILSGPLVCTLKSIFLGFSVVQSDRTFVSTISFVGAQNSGSSLSHNVHS